MRYSLPSRDLIADSIESVSRFALHMSLNQRPTGGYGGFSSPSEKYKINNN